MESPEENGPTCDKCYTSLKPETPKAQESFTSQQTATPSDKSHTEPQKEVPIERECTSCAETFPVEDFPSLCSCEHVSEACQECLLSWWNFRIDNTTWNEIPCITSGCDNRVTHEDVRKFDELSIRNILSNDASFRYCIADGCTFGQIHDSDNDGNIFRCGACGFRACVTHDVPFHTDETCRQYDERMQREESERTEEIGLRREQEAASLEVVGKTAVQCPGCGMNIQKTGGCDHMTCSRAGAGCGYEFCYVCRAPYNGTEGIFQIGNSAHASNCNYHSSRLPQHPDLDET
ncbi:hypothetical protein P280DRAFT_510790, partial [Massarina eburnea CBS 473.64]